MKVFSIIGIGVIAYGDQIFQCPPSNIERCEIVNLNASEGTRITITSLNNVIKIYASQINISNINQVEFIGNEFKGVVTLHFFNSNVRNISKIKFQCFDSLKFLNLEMNKIKFLHNLDFEHVTTITSLFLGQNEISSIEESTFEGLRNLETLSLSGNRIQQILPHTFKGLTNLKELDLNANKLTDIGNIQFPNSLQIIELAINPIRSGLSKLSDLQNLDKVSLIYLCKNLSPADTCCADRHSLERVLTARNVEVVVVSPSYALLGIDYKDECYKDE